MNKYILTDVSIDILWKKLFQIKAIQSFWNVKEWDLGGYVESEKNLAQVSWNAWVFWNARVYWNAQVFWDAQVFWNTWVSWDARVYWDAWVFWDAQVFWNAHISWNAQVSWNAWVSAKKYFTKGWFIGWDDTEKITELSHEQVWNSYWKTNYVLGDYEIVDIEEEKVEEVVTHKIVTDSDWKQYRLVPV